MFTTGNSGVARKNELVIASSFRCALVLILVSWGLTAKLVCSFSAENNAPSRQTRAQTERNLGANSSTQNRNRDSGNNSKRRGLFPTDDDDYDADGGGNTFKNAPFDDSVAFVDPDFEGCDLVELYNKLSALVNIKKDGYETTLEFEKRKNEFLKEESKKAFLGKITLASRIATPIRTFQCRYDADASKLRVVLDDYRYVFPNSVGVLETSADDLIGSLLKTRLPHKYGVVAEKEIGKEFWIKMAASRARDLQE
ncbi:MAG: hypothetical protein IKX88_15965, partial [Thermoguttaceae bacterium]|nr:hypothetical protein [Thermoguttaceae bacterium]